jgi:hypothetical protein
VPSLSDLARNFGGQRMNIEDAAKELYEIANRVWPSINQRWESASAALRDNWIRFATEITKEGWSKE